MKRILFLTYRLPDPFLRDGYSIRILNLAKILKKKYNIDLVSLYENKRESKSQIELQKLFDNLYLFRKNKFSESIGALRKLFTLDPLQEGIYFSSKIQKWVKKHYKNYNLIFCETLRTVKYAENLNIPKVVDLIESLSLKYSGAEKFVNFLWKLIYKIETPRIQKKEEEIIKKFSKIFISSPFDKKYLTSNLQLTTYNSKIMVIPNGVKEELFTNNKQQTTNNRKQNYISFFGKMDYQPNEDAVFWFAKMVFPKIQQKISNLKFYIVGVNPTKKIKNLQKNKNIKVTGFLENPYEILKKSKLIVVPLRFGAGIQNKVLETMALGKALVLSPVAARGIKEGKNGQHFIIEEPQNPELLAQRVLNLISDPQIQEELGKNAKVLVQEKYRWEKIGRKLLQEIGELLK